MTFVTNGRQKKANDPQWEAGTRILRALRIPTGEWGPVRAGLQRMLLEQCVRLAEVCEERHRDFLSALDAARIKDSLVAAEASGAEDAAIARCVELVQAWAARGAHAHELSELTTAMRMKESSK